LKQWLNFLRRRFPEAEAAYQQLKTVNDPVLIGDWLARQQEPLKSGHPLPRHGEQSATIHL
jgi:tRNA-dihydrouridine synthase C